MSELSGRGLRRASASAPRGDVPAALGYATTSRTEEEGARDLDGQGLVIASACERQSLELLGVVHDVDPGRSRHRHRPALSYALQRITAGDASCLVVAELRRLGRSISEVAELLEWFGRTHGRLVAVDLDLDTGTSAGGRVVEALVEVGRWERERVAERTRDGLAALRAGGGRISRPAVSDEPALRERIRTLRGRGVTLQGIADTLNEERVPTLRGGTEWRPSSVQAAVGYKRRTRRRAVEPPPPTRHE